MPTKKAKNATTKKAKADPGKRMSMLDAAAKVLNQADPMTTRQLIEAMAPFWTSPGGATPWNTLSAALRREIEAKGKDARFILADRGKFRLA
jgi:hypothetical protein